MKVFYLLLGVITYTLGGVTCTKDSKNCNLSCTTLLAYNGVAAPDNVTACEYGCTTYNECIRMKKKSDSSYDCLKKSEKSCVEQYTNLKLRASCLAGCNAEHQKNKDSDSLSDTRTVLEGMETPLNDAISGLGLGQDKTQNISLNLQGNIETDVKAKGFLGPHIKKNDVVTKGAKAITDSSIAFDLQGEITNETVSEATLAEHGKGKRLSYGKKGKEVSQNTSLNIQGLVSHNGSYIDVASLYKPIIKEKRQLKKIEGKGSPPKIQKSLTGKQKKKLKKLRRILSKQEKQEKKLKKSAAGELKKLNKTVAKKK